MPHAFDTIEATKLLRCIGFAGTDQRRLGEWAADEIERLRAKVAYQDEVIKAQSRHMHPSASGSYSD